MHTSQNSTYHYSALMSWTEGPIPAVRWVMRKSRSWALTKAKAQHRSWLQQQQRNAGCRKPTESDSLPTSSRGASQPEPLRTFWHLLWGLVPSGSSQGARARPEPQRRVVLPHTATQPGCHRSSGAPAEAAGIRRTGIRDWCLSKPTVKNLRPEGTGPGVLQRHKNSNPNWREFTKSYFHDNFNNIPLQNEAEKLEMHK